LPLPDEDGVNGLWIVGCGPGRMEYMTGRAIDAISGADYVIGNDSYLAPLESLLAGKQVIRSSMGKEVERATTAIDLAQSHKVAIVSGGDAGVYGMAGIVLEVLEHSGTTIPVEVVPGVTAANAGASLVGSPLSGDFATISLSDLLTPLEVIEKRLDAVFSIGIPVVIWTATDEDDLSRCERFLREHSRHVETVHDDGFTLVEGCDPSGLPVVLTYPGPDELARDRVISRVYEW